RRLAIALERALGVLQMLLGDPGDAFPEPRGADSLARLLQLRRLRAENVGETSMPGARAEELAERVDRRVVARALVQVGYRHLDALRPLLDQPRDPRDLEAKREPVPELVGEAELLPSEDEELGKLIVPLGEGDERLNGAEVRGVLIERIPVQLSRSPRV